jgi:dTDP-4-dehydrorhamnose reductase
MRIMVTGANGQVARSLREAAAQDPTIQLSVGARPDMDLANPQSVRALVEALSPEIVVNAAGYTAVDRAEAEPDLAFAINRDGAAAVAEAAARIGAPVIQLSTDYVFDGAKQAPYVEGDTPSPQGVYGQSKFEGELAVAASNPRHLILRTSWVYAPFGANFVRTILRLAAERDELRVVDNQVGRPTYAPDIAAAILQIAPRVLAEWRAEYGGVTHLAGPDAVSWRQFADQIVAGSARRGGKLTPVAPIRTEDYLTAAKRPLNSRLDTRRLNEMFDVWLPPLAPSLERCLDALMGPDPI